MMTDRIERLQAQQTKSDAMKLLKSFQKELDVAKTSIFDKCNLLNADLNEVRGYIEKGELGKARKTLEVIRTEIHKWGGLEEKDLEIKQRDRLFKLTAELVNTIDLLL